MMFGVDCSRAGHHDMELKCSNSACSLDWSASLDMAWIVCWYVNASWSPFSVVLFDKVTLQRNMTSRKPRQAGRREKPASYYSRRHEYPKPYPPNYEWLAFVVLVNTMDTRT